VLYPNIAPIGQHVTTMYNPMTNSNVISYSNQIRQDNQRAMNNSQAPQQQLQYRHQQRFTNTQQRNAFRNIRPIISIPVTEVIDLSSPPSSPAPTMLHETIFSTNTATQLRKSTKQISLYNASNNPAYKVNNIFFIL